MINTFESTEQKRKQKKIFIHRVVFAGSLSFLVLGIILFRLINLQVVYYLEYSRKANDNLVSIEYLEPIRGNIVDRNYVTLASNTPLFYLDFSKSIDDLDFQIKKIKEILPNIPDIKFQQLRKDLKTKILRNHVTLEYPLDKKETAVFAARSYQFPKVILEAKVKRYYPYGKLASHVLGYVAKINAKEKQKYSTSDYRINSVIGKAGVERYYENVLRGTAGIQKVETNAWGKNLSVIDTVEPKLGKELRLTIDFNLQKHAEDLLRKWKGSIVAINPNNGDVLAMVSMPNYNLNSFAEGFSYQEYNALLNSPSKPFLNRAINGIYPPGSTFKPFVALSALEQDLVKTNHTVIDSGKFKYQDITYRGWKRDGLGKMNIYKAIKYSSDIYFYQIGLKMGVDKINGYLKQFGFGKKTNIDLNGESTGLLPTKEWKKKVKKQHWFPGDTIISAIGQGYNLITPLQLAHLTTIIANKGRIIEPRISFEKNIINRTPVKVNKVSHWDGVIEAMISVMSSPGGTAYASGHDLKFKMAGKTGTVQVFSLNNKKYDENKIQENLRDHSLFVGFAPIDNPKIAVATVVENAGNGSAVAAPMTVKLIKSYLESLEMLK